MHQHTEGGWTPEESDNFLNRVRTQLDRIPHGAAEQVLVAVSTGSDSMVLLDALIKLGLKISVAHCNFQIRDEALIEETFIIDYCKLHNLPCYTKRFELQALQETGSISLQTAARKLRYQWFAELMHKHHLSSLMTAHHADDQVETILFNLFRSTGIKGLRGMKFQSGHIFRPLLDVWKSEILAYAQYHSIRYFEDKSNQTNQKENHHEAVKDREPMDGVLEEAG